jgi:ketosteroid isomerase-like protein
MEKESIQNTDSAQLSVLNAQFIKNFLNQDVKAHSEIIHDNFVCIESSGAIVSRDEYLKNWATDFDNSGYTSFAYTDELIRIFGPMALVRAKTVYTKNTDGKKVEGYTIYTDTYIKETGKWQYVQVQITPVKTG